ncbi:hypothetical protein T492DRAFT_252087 [Pavlovales sp. CCMP2436]|nr:hypothetical protein T492DRAFT_252087 [Pavlovales sp. CCMP2436]
MEQGLFAPSGLGPALPFALNIDTSDAQGEQSLGGNAPRRRKRISCSDEAGADLDLTLAGAEISITSVEVPDGEALMMRSADDLLDALDGHLSRLAELEILQDASKLASVQEQFAALATERVQRRHAREGMLELALQVLSEGGGTNLRLQMSELDDVVSDDEPVESRVCIILFLDYLI